MRNFFRLVLLILVLAVLALGPRAWNYFQNQGVLPSWVTLAGKPPAGATLEEIAKAIEVPYQEPVRVYYGEDRVLLRPKEVGFRVDTETMLDQAETQREGLGFWRGFIDEVLHRTPDPVDVPLSYSMDEVQLRYWLSDAAESYDRPPSSALMAPIQLDVPFTTTVVFRPGQPGLKLDAQASVDGLQVALAAPNIEARETWLTLIEAAPPPPEISLLDELLRERMDASPLLSSVFVRHLASGQEVDIRGDVAYSGMSMMKIPIMLSVFKQFYAHPTPDITEAMTSTMTLLGASNAYANRLLAQIGVGDQQKGASEVTSLLHRLGLVNSFMIAPYDSEIAAARVVTKANSRTDFNANPDMYMQTTPKDVGLLLEMITLCAENRGALLAAYPGELTADECQELIGVLELNPITTFIKSGLPEGTRLAHKHGFSNENTSDAAIVWGPGGPFVISISVYQPTWVEFRHSQPLMADITKATWDFFALWSSTQMD